MKQIVLLVAFSLPIIGCTQEVQGGLPSMPEVGNCISGEGPSLCEWRNSSDVVVYGVVRSVEALKAPMIYGSETGELRVGLAENCTGTLFPALRIFMDVDRATTSDFKPQVEFFIGAAVTTSWDPQPLHTVDGETVWTSTDGAIVPGQQLGAALTKRADDSYTTLGERLFVENGGVLQFQRMREECFLGPPTSTIVLDDMFTAPCSQDVGAERGLALRESRAHRIWQDMAKCSAYGAPDGECARNIDCPAGSICSNRSCIVVQEESGPSDSGPADDDEGRPTD